MRFRFLTSIVPALIIISGCAATIDQGGLEQRTAQAIGRTVGEFTISDRSEETGGRINYTVKTADGATYRCYLYGATGLQKAVSFGQIPHSDAVCTAMLSGKQSNGGQAPGATGAAPRGAGGQCNALLRAAGRC